MLTNIKSVDALRKLALEKSSKYLTKRIQPASLEDVSAHGWIADKTYKRGDMQVKKVKPYGIATADRIWSVVSKMRFLYMNGPDPAQLSPEGKTPLQHTVEIDTVSIDREVGVAIFLKASPAKREADGQFRQDLELYANARSEFSQAINQQTYKPADRHYRIKAALVVFVCNITISEADQKFAREKNIALFDENDLEYYEELVEHLGAAAKYQFLADVLDDAEIPALHIKVPAIRLKIGKIIYYSFAIQPEYLLKISYIAHRARGKKADLQAYQRMAEKQRLEEMKEYIDKPALFPTNIVINLKNKPIFTEAKLPSGADDQCGDLGVLQLRSTYKSAWIIDGQHRLYSYSGHARATSALLSVLAFEELPASMQAEFFIDINSKQKPVKQSLLQELFDKVHKDAPDPADRMKSFISQAIALLTSQQESPFYQRIQGAEDRKNSKRCITWNNMFNAISDKIFTDSEIGVFCVKGNDEATINRIVSVVKQWFIAVKKDVLGWWDAGSGSGGGLAMNDSITACFLALKNVIQHLQSKQSDLILRSNQEVTELLLPYALIMSKYLASLNSIERQEYRDHRGAQGQVQRARAFLIAIHRECPEFYPPALMEYMQREKEQAKGLSLGIKQLLIDLVTMILQDEFGVEGQQWWIEGVPYNTQQTVLRRYQDDKGQRGGKEKYFDISDCQAIIQENWSLFKTTLAYSSSPGYSEKRLAWLQKINDIQNCIDRDEMLTPEQLDELGRHNDWLRNRLFQKESSINGEGNQPPFSN